MKKMLFVMSPCSGQKKANKYLLEILDMFNRGGYQVTVHITAGPGDATQAVCRQCAGMDLVVCCGGDGTFNETVSGLLMAGQDIPVGYIPAGSTNDFAASMKLLHDIGLAAPDSVELCWMLNQQGYELPLTKLDAKECAQALYDWLEA